MIIRITVLSILLCSFFIMFVTGVGSGEFFNSSNELTDEDHARAKANMALFRSLEVGDLLVGSGGKIMFIFEDAGRDDLRIHFLVSLNRQPMQDWAYDPSFTKIASNDPLFPKAVIQWAGGRPFTQ